MARYVKMSGGVVSEIYINPRGFTVDGNKYPKNWRDLASLNIFPITQAAKPVHDEKTQKLVMVPVVVGGSTAEETWNVVNLTQDELDARKHSEINQLHSTLNTTRIIEDVIGYIVVGEPIPAAVKAKINQIRVKRGQDPL